ncbi:unnamed protein product [Rhizophagus irregularis]|nr:unnamed protein product [Rhizophagus irregularis]
MKTGLIDNFWMKRRNFTKHENMKVNSTFLSCDGVQIGCVGNNIQGNKRSFENRKQLGVKEAKEVKDKVKRTKIDEEPPAVELSDDIPKQNSPVEPPTLVDRINNPFFLEKDEVSKSEYRRDIPLPSQPELELVSSDNHESDSFSDNGLVNCPAIINDVMELQLGSLPRKESRWILNDIDVSEKWHIFKEKSLELANREGLFVESHTQQILSLSHVLLLKPKQHCPLMH